MYKSSKRDIEIKEEELQAIERLKDQEMKKYSKALTDLQVSIESDNTRAITPYGRYVVEEAKNVEVYYRRHTSVTVDDIKQGREALEKCRDMVERPSVLTCDAAKVSANKLKNRDSKIFQKLSTALSVFAAITFIAAGIALFAVTTGTGVVPAAFLFKGGLALLGTSLAASATKKIIEGGQCDDDTYHPGNSGDTLDNLKKNISVLAEESSATPFLRYANGGLDTPGKRQDSHKESVNQR